MLHCTARHGSVVCTPRSSREQGRAFVRHTRLTRVSATSVNLAHALSHWPSLTGPDPLSLALSHWPRPSLTGPLTQALSHRPSLTGPLSLALSHRPSLTGPLSLALTHRPSLSGPLSQALSHRPSLTGPLSLALSYRPSLTGPLSLGLLSSFYQVFDVFHSSPSTEEKKTFKSTKNNNERTEKQHPQQL